MDTRDKDQEIRSNFKAFEKKLPDIIEAHRGKFALMRHGEIVEYFDTARDAYLFGRKQYEDGLFSIQEVIQAPIDLGWFSRAPSHADV